MTITSQNTFQKPPRHVAIIMDGNGRWARKRALPRTMGHKRGAQRVRDVIEFSAKAGVEYLTLFGFSSENWNRPEDEVKELMSLLRQYLRSQTAEFHQKNARLSVIGNRAAFDDDIVQLIESAEKLTKDNDGIHVIMALNYGGRQDIAQATQALISQAIETGKTPNLSEIEQSLSCALFTKAIPDPDLLIRTSGEQRISNFLLWQCAYSEMVFIDTLWPDFSEQDFMNALDSYSSRDRRFGAIKKSEA